MTRTPIAARRHAEAAQLARAARVASRLSAAKVADAAAHARTVLTDALDRTPEGRPTTAAVRRSRSYAAALARLDELRDALAALAEDLRVAAYRDAFAFWSRRLPADVLRDPGRDQPPASRVERCRTWPLHGFTLRQWLDGPVSRAQRALAPALTVAGNRATTARDAADAIRRWARGAEGSIRAAAVAALVDGQTLADRLAGRDTIRPELLDPDPTLPE